MKLSFNSLVCKPRDILAIYIRCSYINYKWFKSNRPNSNITEGVNHLSTCYSNKSYFDNSQTIEIMQLNCDQRNKEATFKENLYCFVFYVSIS